MADMTKCNNKDCPIQSNCYRKIAKDSEHQSWATFEYKKSGNWGSCEYYYPMPVIPKGIEPWEQ